MNFVSSGKFVTQGAGDIVQSALFQAGTTVVNRRDPRIMETEIHEAVLSCTRARRQMIEGILTEKPTVH